MIIKLIIQYIILFSVFFSTAFANNIVHDSDQQYHEAIRKIERKNKGRLGITLLDHQGKILFDYKSDSRFPMASTAKLMAAATILKKHETNNLLDKEILIDEAMLVNYNPIVEKNINKKMSIRDLIAAALQYSDNAAMNILLRQIGGPKAVTKFARSIGDKDFELDRFEPELNSAIPFDNRDTTTPIAMAKSLHALTFGKALSDENTNLLITWLKGNTTGETSIKSGIPSNWIIGDKAGAADYGTTNDIAIIWPENSDPVILVIFFSQFQKDVDKKYNIFREIMEIILPLIECKS